MEDEFNDYSFAVAPLAWITSWEHTAPIWQIHMAIMSGTYRRKH